MTITKAFDAGVRSPVPRQARVLLGRADALLSESIGESDAGDRFLGSYAAALKGAAAVLASLPNSIGARPRSRNAWVLMAKAAPELAVWSDYFGSFSATRAAVEAGASSTVADLDADDFYRHVSRFLNSVDDRLGGQSRFASVDPMATPLSA
ncbi:SAV_6107 family HEPN domain-containing protein [Rhodococcoides yunnanense]|uniref:SAV_6107 family HEPN domain-containing protein n=1 Tax=Rhodococcoides yunnanense TaxID=278209 RepID=A0ABU4BDK9_9NOCA|nr:SAV_6107 family HEPN domain-containing protein [Rhodococcus yunnanensis]MDV6262288.1 SAV_6107 family HEPN domain-containing protein [Rhodococcus yunnanensis]